MPSQSKLTHCQLQLILKLSFGFCPESFLIARSAKGSSPDACLFEGKPGPPSSYGAEHFGFLSPLYALHFDPTDFISDDMVGTIVRSKAPSQS